jgi:hypothetical protein
VGPPPGPPPGPGLPPTPAESTPHPPAGPSSDHLLARIVSEFRSPPRSTADSDRLPPAVQAQISALLTLPTMVGYFAADGPLTPKTGLVSWFLYFLVDLYLVLVVARWGRSPQRRVYAIVIALVGVAVDRGFNLIFLLNSASSPWPVRIADFSTVLFVAAWGVARRRHPLWLLGVPFSVGIVAVTEWYYEARNWAFSWFGFWAIDVGAFVLSCLVCWTFDSLGNRARQKAPAQA